MVNAATLPVMTRGTLLQTHARGGQLGLGFGATLQSLIGVYVHIVHTT